MRRSQMHNFAHVPAPKIQRSGFDRSANWNGSFDEGKLVPFYCEEILLGDTFHVRANVFARMTSALVVPAMANLTLFTHFFFVPNRLVWDNWQRFMGEQDDPDDSTDYLIPTVTVPIQGFPFESSFDTLGIPPMVAPTPRKYTVNALPFRAINLIFNQWYRDQNLQPSLPVFKGDGPDVASTYLYDMRVNKFHDYFTSALPWTQKGTAPTIPIGNSAPVTGTIDVNSTNINTFNYTSGTAKTGPMIFSPGTASGGGTYNSAGVSVVGSAAPTNLSLLHPAHTVTHSLSANLSSATAVTINDLRLAFQVQRLLEAQARGGTRYTEIIQGLFGVYSPDARLQRPELLGVGSQRININPTVQTSESTAQSPQANLAAFGTSLGNKHGFAKSFTEHGFIIGFVFVKSELQYQQGLEREWTRQTKYDHYWPQFAHLGEQAILNQEIYLQGNTQDEDVFGYQERWADYRYKQSLITGRMRSSYPQSLDVWHTAQDFGALPTLSATFIMEDAPRYRDWETDRKSTRLNSSHSVESRMPSAA